MIKRIDRFKSLFSQVQIHVFLIVLIGGILMNSSGFCDDHTRRESLLKGLEIKAHSHIRSTFLKNEDNYWAEPDSPYISSYYANLGEKRSLYAAIFLTYHMGEGCRDHYLVVFSIENPLNPKMVTAILTHGEYMSFGYGKITDLDGDGENEILVVGDTDGDGFASCEIMLYSLRKNRLKDMIWGADPGSEYYIMDLDQDGKKEIISLKKNVESEAVAIGILKTDVAGYYRLFMPKPSKKDKVLLSIFDHLILNDAGHRGFPLLIDVIKKSGQIPEFYGMIQEKLKKIYNEPISQNGNAPIPLEALAWPGNKTAVPFLIKRLASDDGEDKIAAVDALGVIGDSICIEHLHNRLERLLTQTKGINYYDCRFSLSLITAMNALGDKRGIDLVINASKDATIPLDSRRSLIAYVLGNLLPDTETALLAFSLNSTEPEIRRLASYGLEDSDPEKTRITLEKWIAGLRSADPNVRASFALTIGRLNMSEAAVHIMKAIENEKEKLPRRQMLIALNELKAKQAAHLLKRLLMKEDDPEIRNRIFWLIEHWGITIEDSLWKMLQNKFADPSDLKNLIELAVSRKRVEALPAILKLACESQECFVKRTAVEALASFDHPESRKTLRKLVLEDDDWVVRSKAAKALEILIDLGAETALATALEKDSHHCVVDSAAKALSVINTEHAQKVLLENFRRKGGENQYEYIDALASCGAKEKANVLAKAMIDMERDYLSGKGDVNPNLMARIALRLHEIHDSRGEKALVEWMKPNYPKRLRILAISTAGTAKEHFWPPIKKYAQDELREIREEVIRCGRPTANTIWGQ